MLCRRLNLVGELRLALLGITQEGFRPWVELVLPIIRRAFHVSHRVFGPGVRRGGAGGG